MKMKELYDILRSVGGQDWPFEVKVILLCTLAFFSIAFLLFFFILISRLMDGLAYAQKRWMDKKAQQVITSFLFQQEVWGKARLRKFRLNYLSNRFFRAVFLKSLITLHKNIIGESSERLRLLYQELGLKKQAIQKLQSNSWAKAARGICELAEMGTAEDSGIIRAFANHKNPMLRSEAQVALLKLEGDAPFSFLDELKEPLSEWQQLQLMRAAQQIELKSLPDFARWLEKKEESIVVFSIRMISQFDQHRAGQFLLGMLKHPFPPACVRSEIIMAVRQMMLTGAEETLSQLYAYEKPEIQIEIEKALAVITAGEGMLATNWRKEEEKPDTDIGSNRSIEDFLNGEEESLLAI